MGTMSEPVRGIVRKAQVALVDDHPLFRQGLGAALAQDGRLEIVGEAGTADEARALARGYRIDIAIVDVLMPTISGISLCSDLHELQPACKVLGLSVIDDPGLIADMLRAHACGFASKIQPVAEIIAAIHQVLGGLRYLPPHVSRDAVDGQLARGGVRPLDRLTRREREIFELLIRGNSNDEVASRLVISRRTVETHRQRIVRKLSAHSIVEMQRLAATHGGLA